ncbi:MAG: hypothetical protein ABFS42_15540, partial [Candidatus Krumholzibacteriota bacterium]
MKTVFIYLALVIILPAAVPAAAEVCGQPEADQFDFWVGEWYVFAQDKLVGRNTISRVHKGCTLVEEYTAAGGKYAGRSFNYFEPEDGLWHQIWVDDAGTRLHLTGGYADGKMVLSGDRLMKSETVTDRISWTDNPDGTVRQLWEHSKDGGESWQVLFDGEYRRVGEKVSGGG